MGGAAPLTDPPGTVSVWTVVASGHGCRDRRKRGVPGCLPEDVVTACHRVPHRSLLSNIYFLFLVFLEVPVLLSMLSAVLWVNRPQGLWVEVESAG